MANFNWVDYVCIAIFVLSMLAGFGRGFVKEVVSLATIIAAFIVATMFAQQLAVHFTSSSAVQNVVTESSSAIGMSTAQPVSYAAIGVAYGLLFVGTMIVGAIIGFFLNMAFSIGILGIGNRILGAAFGLARGLILVLVIIFCIQLTSASTASWWRNSQIVAQYQPAVIWLGNMVSPHLATLKEKAAQTLQDVNTSLGR
jgi:membrane protein required for colicin V production